MARKPCGLWTKSTNTRTPSSETDSSSQRSRLLFYNPVTAEYDDVTASHAAGLLARTAERSAVAADLNIGVVNIARLLEEAPQAKSALSKLQDEFAARQQQIVAEEQELRSRAEELQKAAQRTFDRNIGADRAHRGRADPVGA